MKKSVFKDEEGCLEDF